MKPENSFIADLTQKAAEQFIKIIKNGLQGQK
jgi:hypothetical protein